MTLVVGVFAWGLMPPGPTQTKGWLRGKDGWFTERYFPYYSGTFYI